VVLAVRHERKEGDQQPNTVELDLPTQAADPSPSRLPPVP